MYTCVSYIVFWFVICNGIDFKEGDAIMYPHADVVERIANKQPYYADTMKKIGKYFNGEKCLGIIFLLINN